MPHLWLIGMMGSGKTTVGEQAAAVLGLSHQDVDQTIERRMGSTISEIFATHGEETFRQWERAEIAQMADLAQDSVISTGGGVVLDDANLHIMRSSGVVIWLDAPTAVLSRRVEGGRPLLDGGDPATILEVLLSERRDRYEAAAHYVVDADRPRAEIATQLGEYVRYGIGDASEILIGPDLPHRILPESPRRSKAVVLAQPSVMSLAWQVTHRLADRGLEVPAPIQLPDRDEAKSVETTGAIYLKLAETNLGRGDTIVGVGGGAATDLVGFVAATWLRGVENVLVPTTLLAAVDAAIGGKTGVNVAGKNLVGAFWHPRRVVVSLSVLESLPPDLLREGAAEALKAGLIADPQLVDLYSTHGLEAPLGEVVRRAIAVKTQVVAEDFRESGRRAILNFGHTIGHGLETACGLSHGHAVAVGMAAEATISALRYGFDPSLVLEPLHKLGLPTRVEAEESADRQAILSFISRDKKRTSQGLRMVLLRSVGDPVVEPVSQEDIDVGLAAVGVADA